ncbi:MAG: nucleotide sugar dehydrogenase [Chthoniobacterales bacterium]
MNIVVLGLWHLGCVTAACCAEHFPVIGIDFDEGVVRDLSQGQAPLFEPGLDHLIKRQLEAGNLSFSSDSSRSLHSANVLWVCYDTPVDDNDVADNDYVLRRLEQCLPSIREGCLVLISSQLPVGTCSRLQAKYPNLRFACSPENLRLGHALESFRERDRVIAGVADDSARGELTQLFAPFAADRMLWMRPESAEMIKHATNAFLALSVTFANEMARLCESHGANAYDLARGLRSDARIGPKAYLRPGAAFAGGTLARDVVTLTHLAQSSKEEVPLIKAILSSNDVHKQWPLRQLEAAFLHLDQIKVAVLGLTYKPGTDTLRRSSSIELCFHLLSHGCNVSCYDPAVNALPVTLDRARLCSNLAEAIDGVAAIMLMTAWPEITQVDWTELLRGLGREVVIIDVNHALNLPHGPLPHVRYFSLGSP